MVKGLRVRVFTKTFMLVLIVLVISGAIRHLDNSGYISIPVNVNQIINSVLVAAAVLFFTGLFVKSTKTWVYNFFEKELEVEQRIFLAKLYTFAVYSFGVSIILYRFGLGLQDITLVLGLLTTGLAFAIRDLIFAFFMWIVVLTKKPFRIGNVVGFGEDYGLVERIGTFYFTLRPVSGEGVVKIANKSLFDKGLRVYNKNKVPQEIVLKLKTIPKTLQSKISQIEKENGVSVVLNVEGKEPCLAVSYECAFDEISKRRSEIVSSILSKNSNFLM